MTETTTQNQNATRDADGGSGGPTTAKDDYATGAPAGEPTTAATGTRSAKGPSTTKDDYATGTPARDPKEHPKPQDDYAT